jgi:hypothetical protein
VLAQGQSTHERRATHDLLHGAIGAARSATCAHRALLPLPLEEITMMTRSFDIKGTPFARCAGTMAAALLVAACAHQPEGSSVTSVTSGSTSGVKVTSARVDRDEPAMRLADELCSRAAACNQIGEGARYRSEEACMADQGAQAPAQIARWTCTPTATQAGFEECLAAIRSERCETALPRVEQLIACRSVQVCGR